MYNSLMPIEILPDEVVSQIAAGEVVERPASVIKELVENSLDAGAHAIDVQTAGAGKKLLEVRDDGRGIPQDELKIAVTRHATSKLHVAADLFSIHTLGFRGEALASIGSVSQMTLISRAYDAEIGAKVIVDGGRLERVEQAGVPTGTTVRVENLFFNVPARLKFMKSDLTERRQIDEVVTRYALAYPEVRFTLNQEGKTALHTTGSGDRREILAAMIGVDQSRQMLEVLADQDDIIYTFESQRYPIFCKRQAGTRRCANRCITSGLSHDVDGRTLSIRPDFYGITSFSVRCERASNQSRSSLSRSRSNIQCSPAFNQASTAGIHTSTRAAQPISMGSTGPGNFSKMGRQSNLGQFYS
jgi:DNA mismatch repair protein MutL